MIIYYLQSVFIFQELDLENIQLLSEQLLSGPYSAGVLGAVNPAQGSRLSQLSLLPLVSLTSLVYDNPLRLKRELAVAIARASHQGEDYLIELTNQLCMCLQVKDDFIHIQVFKKLIANFCIVIVLD